MSIPYNINAIKHGSSIYICVPASIRKALDIRQGTQITIWLKDRQIRAEKTVTVSEGQEANLPIGERENKPWLR